MKKIMIGIMIGLLLGSIGVYAAYKYQASEVSYKDTTVEAAVEDLYGSAGALGSSIEDINNKLAGFNNIKMKFVQYDYKGKVTTGQAISLGQASQICNIPAESTVVGFAFMNAGGDSTFDRMGHLTTDQAYNGTSTRNVIDYYPGSNQNNHVLISFIVFYI